MRASRRRRPLPAPPCRVLSFQALEPRLPLTLIDPVFVAVGDPGNAPDPATGFGQVTDSYRISQYEVTIGEYVAFLNAVAADDPLGLFNPSMGGDKTSGGIEQTASADGFTYRAIGPFGDVVAGAESVTNRPITYVNWFDAARFANWMANGQPQGGQTVSTTENGAYDLTSSDGTQAVPRNATNPNTHGSPSFFLPTENEWYKAAYYDPTLNAGSGGYFLYATRQNTAPTNNAAATSGPIANYLQGPIYSVTQSEVFSPTQNYLTDVGVFATSVSAYGTLDQNGNVYQWNDLTGERGLYRGLRGGFWAGGAVTLQSTTFTQVTATRATNDTGFRLVAVPPPAPEPIAFMLASNGEWLRLTSDGKSLQTAPFASWSSRVDWQFPCTADFNGDGRPDVAAMTPGGAWWVACDAGEGSSQTVRMTQWSATAGWTDVVTGDFNADGRTDIVGRSLSGQWWAAYTNDGAGPFTSRPVGYWNATVDWKHVLLADAAGDGVPDLIGLATAEPTAANGSWWVSRVGDASFESAVRGSLRLPSGVSIRATLPTVS